MPISMLGTMRGVMRTLFTLLLVATADAVQARVSTTTSVVSVYLAPGGEQLELAYKVVKSDYRCPLIGHGCTNKPISALLYGQLLDMDGRDALPLDGNKRYVLREEVSDATLGYSSWRNRTLLRPARGDMDTLTACHSPAPGKGCDYSAQTAPRQLQELFRAHSVSADGTLLFAGGVLYTLPDLAPQAEVSARPGYAAFLAQLRDSFDTGMSWHSISQVPLGREQILGMPDYTTPERDTLAYLYDVASDAFTAVPLELGKLRQRFPEGRMGLEIRDYVYRPGGVTLFLEVLLYGLQERAPRHYVVLDSASGAFAEIPLEDFSVLDFHLLDTAHSRLVWVNRDIRGSVQVQLYPYRL